MALKEYQAWGTPDGCSVTFSTADGIQDMMREASWEPNSVFLYSIWARSRLDAMQQHNRAQGWEEYKPTLDDNGDRRQLFLPVGDNYSCRYRPGC